MKLVHNDTFLPQKVKNNYRASIKYVPYTVTSRYYWREREKNKAKSKIKEI
jgi:hypothetical protein